MKRLLLLLCLFCVLCPAAYGEELPVAAWLYRGADRCPLPGATFTLADRTATTDADGRAVFTDLTPGTYTLRETAAPAPYLPLSRPIRVQLLPGGGLEVEGADTREVSVLHRSGRRAALAVAILLSALPLSLRLLWLRQSKKN